MLLISKNRGDNDVRGRVGNCVVLGSYCIELKNDKICSMRTQLV